MDALGKSPIPLPYLVLGKLATAGSIAFFFMKTQVAGGLLYDGPLTRTAGALLAAAGLLLLVLGFTCLGRSVSVGLPEEQTLLKTRGVYRITRNPMYFGGFLICAGSCLYAMHPVNILLAAIAIGIHHWIVTREELFLAKRFGQQWLDYSRHAPRYLGMPRH